MSVINQMLRDLDRQRGPASVAEITALRGLGLVAADSAPWRRLGRHLAWGLTAVASVVLIQWLFLDSSGVSRSASLKAQVRQPLPLPPEQPRRTKTLTASLAPVVALPAANAARAAPAEIATQAIAAVEAAPVREPIGLPAVSAAKTPALTPEQKARRLFNRAQSALAKHDRAKAADLLQQVLAQDPQHGTAREQLAVLMIQDGQREYAETLLADGVVLTPLRFDLARAYAQLLVERGALLPALQTLQRFTDSPTADADALGLRAGILDRLQRYSEAADAYKRALRQQPRQAVWWTGLGVALEHQGQPVTALDAYRRAMELPLQDAVRSFVQQRIQTLDKSGSRVNG